MPINTNTSNICHAPNAATDPPTKALNIETFNSLKSVIDLYAYSNPLNPKYSDQEVIPIIMKIKIETTRESLI